MVELNFEEELTILVGGNGSGKTAVLQAVSRLFGTSSAQRSVQRRDFHIPLGRQELQSGDSLFVEAVLAFPELEEQDATPLDAVPEFFNQMAASGEGGPLKARIRLQATWTDDGTPEGAIEEDIRWIRALDDNFEWDDCSRIQAVERSSIQFIYLPANRDATTQVTALLKGGYGRLPNGRRHLGMQAMLMPVRSRAVSKKRSRRSFCWSVFRSVGNRCMKPIQTVNRV